MGFNSGVLLLSSDCCSHSTNFPLLLVSFSVSSPSGLCDSDLRHLAELWIVLRPSPSHSSVFFSTNLFDIPITTRERNLFHDDQHLQDRTMGCLRWVHRSNDPNDILNRPSSLCTAWCIVCAICVLGIAAAQASAFISIGSMRKWYS